MYVANHLSFLVSDLWGALVALFAACHLMPDSLQLMHERAPREARVGCQVAHPCAPPNREDPNP